MIETKNIQTFNWEGAIRGMRNPLESWCKSDSDFSNGLNIGEKDLDLMKRLVRAGSDERKFMRQIFVSMDITAPMYWWKEADTYKVATVANSTSTMHKLTSRPIVIRDFSIDHMTGEGLYAFAQYIDSIESFRKAYVDGGQKDRCLWYTIIQMLPSSYNQTRTWTANYEVLRNIYHARKNHKLDEWRDFCHMIESLPYSELITQ